MSRSGQARGRVTDCVSGIVHAIAADVAVRVTSTVTRSRCRAHHHRGRPYGTATRVTSKVTRYVNYHVCDVFINVESSHKYLHRHDEDHLCGWHLVELNGFTANASLI